MTANKTLSEMFKQARQTSPAIPLSEIKSLVESGKTSPLAAKRSFSPRRIKQMFNPLKFLIMITTIAIITTVLITFNALERKESLENVRPIESQMKEKLEIAAIPSEKTLKQAITTEQKSLGAPVQYPDKRDGLSLKDTVFKGKILDLSKEDLTRLGFMFDEEGFYYLNRLPNGNLISFWSWKSGSKTHHGFEESRLVNQYNRQKETTLDFYPVLQTDISGKNFQMINPYRSFNADALKLMNDTLVPVLVHADITAGTFKNDVILWFKPSETFFRQIPGEGGRSAQMRITAVNNLNKITSAQIDRVRYDFRSVPVDPLKSTDSLRMVNSLHTVKLSPEIFSCMGFKIASDTVEYLFSNRSRWLSVEVYGQGTRMKIHMTIDSIQATQKRVILYFIARFGEDGRTHPMGNAYGNQDTYQQDLEFCVPVQLDNPNLPPFVRNAIFWIYPNETFFECLPPEIARPMRMEFNYQKKRLDPDFVPLMGGSIGIGGGAVKDTVRMGGSVGIGGRRATREDFNMGVPIRIPDQGFKKDSVNDKIEPVPCVYFTNLCESIPGLDYVNLYPNPASAQLNVDLVLQKAKKIRFRAYDLGGRVISDEGAAKDFPAGGQFTHQMDISKLKSGFYLLVMTDEEGAKVTRRFVKQ
ncbi:MAG: T9SS type A sorting domain-containing protein [Bacteroidia bacterium]|nr:T9SS type A sorting domain-containing protein [Bacteroidia bacterium]